MDIKILVAAHKKYWMPDDSVYLPIHVGREGKQDIGYTGDNTGDNISAKNANYCELTGLYWAWKNLECDYIGLCHYRRYFCNDYFGRKILTYNNFERKIKSIFDREDYQKLLKNYDILLPKKLVFKNQSIYEHYNQCHNIKDLNECFKILSERYPKYVSAYQAVMKQNKLYACNMFVTKREYFNEYMEWLFNILFELEKRINISDYDNYQARIYGFLSERLFNVWLEKKRLSIKEVPIVNLDNQGSIFKAIKNKIKNL